MGEIALIAVSVGVLTAMGIVLFRGLSARSPRAQRDLYLEALEAWVDGDLENAELLLRQLVNAEPDGTESYLQLGNLLRRKGDPRKAAVLHRALIARANLPEAFKIQVGLALAEDLLALDDPISAGQVLDTLIRKASNAPRYWWARFQQWFKKGDMEEAARALKQGSKHKDFSSQVSFEESLGYFQLDRAYDAACTGQPRQARALLKEIPPQSPASIFAPLVLSVCHIHEGDLHKAMDTAVAGLQGLPEALDAFHCRLRPVLLEQGHFERSIPMLERFAQDANNPLSLTLELALLYEKTGKRQKAIRLLQEQRGRVDLTPDRVAAFLTVLIRSGQDRDIQEIWSSLTIPEAGQQWHCSRCGYRFYRLGWVCPDCHSFGPLVRDSHLEEIQQ